MTSTTLYRLHDAAGHLLYVGIGGNPGRRFEQHHGDKPWWGQVAHITLEHHPTRQAALTAELKAIRTENPRHNIAGRLRLVVPAWEHRPLLNGAYLDTEDRGGYAVVTINRDDLALQLQHAGQPWRVPAPVAAAHEHLARVAARCVWARGLAVDEDIPVAAGRWRSVRVTPEHVPAAQRALTASELRGDVTALDRLAARLAS